MLYYLCMKNKRNNRILKTGATLAVFVFMVSLLAAPIQTNAAQNYVWGETVTITPIPTSPASYNQNYYNNYPSPTNYGYPQYAPANYNYTGVNPTPAPTYTNPPTPTVDSSKTVSKTSAPKTVAKATTPKTSIPADPNGYVLVPKSQLLAINPSQLASISDNASPANGLTANPLFGAKGFLPSGILGWTLVAIFILLIVILARAVFGRTKTYLATPLKHS